MALTMKDKYARLNLSELPADLRSQFEEISQTTDNFSDDELNSIMEEEFEENYRLVEKYHPAAIKTGGTIKKVKPAKVKKVKPKKQRPGMPPEEDFDGKLPEHLVHKGEKKDEGFKKDYNYWHKHYSGMPKADFERVYGTYYKKLMKDPEFIKTMNERAKAIYDIAEERHDAEFAMRWKETDEIYGKKLSADDIEFIETTLRNDEASTDEEMAAHFVAELGITEAQAKKWLKKRSMYLAQSVEHSISYKERTKLKKGIRESERKKDKSRKEQFVTTRDGKEFDRQSSKNVGKTFYDENGHAWKCQGYNKELDECIFRDSDGKEISSCLKDMYVSNPVAKREKGNLVDDCKDTLKEAGFTIREHKAGKKKIRRAEPRPEKEIIKERVENTFTPIMKDIAGSEEKKAENKEVIEVIESIQRLFVKVFNRISNLADDGKADKLKKIEKLLKELVGE